MTEATAWTPAWREASLPLEWLALRRSPIYAGRGVPRGDGSPVVLVPGFLTRGWYLGELCGWLERIGYAARAADIGWNADCLDVLADRLIGALDDTRRRSGQAAHVIGHSLGGVIGRAVAARAPGLVGSLAVLGSPLRGLRVHPGLRLAAAAVRATVHRRRGASVQGSCLTLACECDTVRAVAGPLPAEMPRLTVLTRRDGLVDWRCCVDPDGATTVEVDASHIGLAWNHAVYEVLARHLAAATAQRSRASRS